jgi:hypothetical protein
VFFDQQDLERPIRSCGSLLAGLMLPDAFFGIQA